MNGVITARRERCAAGHCFGPGTYKYPGRGLFSPAEADIAARVLDVAK
jgi:hypothetical protein